jgi:hypothetical protein
MSNFRPTRWNVSAAPEQMANTQKAFDLDLVFAATSDSTRRQVLAQLQSGSCTLTELSLPYDSRCPVL